MAWYRLLHGFEPRHGQETLAKLFDDVGADALQRKSMHVGCQPHPDCIFTRSGIAILDYFILMYFVWCMFYGQILLFGKMGVP